MFDFLLQQYRLLWNNRKLIEEDTAESVLKKAILQELKDENSHPRVRKSPHEKYFSAIKRIMDSSLPDGVKLSLIKLHTNLMEDL